MGIVIFVFYNYHYIKCIDDFSGSEKRTFASRGY